MAESANFSTSSHRLTWTTMYCCKLGWCTHKVLEHYISQSDCIFFTFVFNRQALLTMYCCKVLLILYLGLWQENSSACMGGIKHPYSTILKQCFFVITLFFTLFTVLICFLFCSINLEFNSNWSIIIIAQQSVTNTKHNVFVLISNIIEIIYKMRTVINKV